MKITDEGLKKLEEELEFLKTNGRADIAEKIKVARGYGDLSENSEYDEAKSEQAKIEARINELRYQLDHAVIIDSGEAGATSKKNVVTMGSKITVVRKNDKKELSYEIVGFSQSDPANGRISDESPVGMALMGAKKGDTVSVEAPIGVIELKIKDVK
ncbi:MAG: transcription elongation factor GreA [Eubacterium sp.]|nr:transcription elongation factor GreA [Eubacterium sp.]